MAVDMNADQAWQARLANARNPELYLGLSGWETVPLADMTPWGATPLHEAPAMAPVRALYGGVGSPSAGSGFLGCSPLPGRAGRWTSRAGAPMCSEQIHRRMCGSARPAAWVGATSCRCGPSPRVDVQFHGPRASPWSDTCLARSEPVGAGSVSPVRALGGEAPATRPPWECDPYRRGAARDPAATRYDPKATFSSCAGGPTLRAP